MTENRCPLCGSVHSEGEKCYVIPTSCWRPREGTGIPADAQMYPPGCPDPEFCRGNRCCNWDCKHGGEDTGEGVVEFWTHAILTLMVGILAYALLAKADMMP